MIRVLQVIGVMDRGGQFSLLTERIIYHLCHRNVSDSCIRFGF